VTYLPSPAPSDGPGAAAAGAVQRPPRPWSVSLAVALVAVTVLALLVSAAVGVEEWIRMSDLVDQAARSTGATPEVVRDEQGIAFAIYVVALAVHALMAIAFVGLTLPVWRGSNGARIALCVTSGLWSLCCGGLVALTAVVPQQPESTAFGQELDRLEETSSPAWTEVAGTLSALVVALVPLAVLALLLIPPSNRFLRRPTPPAWSTGYHFPGYGQYYGYGYYYGYPGQPGSPPDPPSTPGSPPAPPP
jgi:hypothetical protein